MKKILALVLIAVMALGNAAFAAQLQPVSPQLSVAINSADAVLNSQPVSVNPPLLAFGKTYVDLYETAALLNLPLEWIDADTDCVRAGYEGALTDFTIIATYDELSQNNKCFVRDGRIFAAARDIAAAANTTLDFNNWVISFGTDSSSVDRALLGEVNPLVNVDEYIYSTYSYAPQHCVYPYQAYSHEFVVSDANRLAKMYPELIKVGSIGQSVEGRDLVLIEFGKGDKKIFVCGAHHAREYISTTYLMYAIDRFAYMYKTGMNETQYDIRAILDNVTFCIVPMVNPDGVNLVQNGINAVQNPEKVAAMKITEGRENGYRAWKANINGVDPNWNYDKDWFKSREKASSPASTGYNGTEPDSEPETRAVSAYVDSQPFEAYLSMHTQGKLLYWAEDVTNPTNLGRLVQADTGFSLIREDTPKKLSGVGGSFFDYVFRKYGKATMTVELCNYIGPKPYPDASFDKVWAPAKNVLLIFGQTIMNRE